MYHGFYLVLLVAVVLLLYQYLRPKFVQTVYVVRWVHLGFSRIQLEVWLHTVLLFTLIIVGKQCLVLSFRVYLHLSFILYPNHQSIYKRKTELRWEKGELYLIEMDQSSKFCISGGRDCYGILQRNKKIARNWEICKWKETDWIGFNVCRFL